MSELQVVGFGKYKGRSVDEMLSDRSYCEWLLAKPWFGEKYPAIHGVLTNLGAEPQDSPEHNEMQALFLDPERCLSLARILAPNLENETLPSANVSARWAAQYPDLVHESRRPMSVGNIQFEDNGWDVTAIVRAPQHCFEIRGIPDCACPACSCSPNCDRHVRPKAGEIKYGHQSTCDWYGHVIEYSHHRMDWWLLDTKRHSHSTSLGLRLAVELKPDLGDDYPNVLRQVQRYVAADARRGEQAKAVVVVRRARFSTVAWDQVVEIFKMSGVSLIRESALGDATTQASPSCAWSVEEVDGQVRINVNEATALTRQEALDLAQELIRCATGPSARPRSA